MKIIHSNKLAFALASTLFASSAFAADCNNTNNINGWGAWCGVDTFFSEQAPTASGGPIFGNKPYAPASFDSIDFGGQIQEGDDFNWKGYAYINLNRVGTQSGQQKPSISFSRHDFTLGEMNMNMNKETNLIDITLTYKDANNVEQTLQFSENPTFLDATGQFQVQTADGQYQINAISRFALRSKRFYRMPGMVEGANPTQNKDVTSGGIRDNIDDERIGYFTGGRLTPVDVIQSFINSNKVANYSLMGDFKRNDRDWGGAVGNMSVNFGNASFKANWQGLGNNYYGPFPGMGYGSVDVSGQVDGNSFKSNTITATQTTSQMAPPIGPDMAPIMVPITSTVTVTGEMKGSFNGDQAQALSGSLTVDVDGGTTKGVFIGVEAPISLPNTDK